MVARLDQAAPLVGNIGLLVDDDTVALWTFAEVAGVACSDQVGTVDDLAADGVDLPSIVPDGAWAQSIARNFTDGGFVAGDRTGAELTSAITRDLTIQAILSIPLDGTPRATIVARGLGGSSAERVAFALEVHPIGGGGTDTHTIRLCWEDSAGVETIDTGADFVAPPTGVEVLLVTATRRWEASDRVVCRYYIGGDLVGESTSTGGAIAGDTTGHLSIGCRKVAGVFDRRWASTIDELKITAHEMQAEQVAATWRRLAVHQPAGAELVQALPAPGAPISGNPDSRIQRLLRLAGQALGLAAARGEQLGDIMPDRAYGRVLERWEQLAGLPSLGLASVEARRVRLVAHLRRKGWTEDNVFDAVAVLLDADAGDLELDNFSNTYGDTFATLRAERWNAEIGASSQGWDVTGGKLRARAAVADGLRLDGTHRDGLACMMSITHARAIYVAARVTLTSLPNDGAEAGLYLRHGHNGDHLFLGVRNTAGVYEVVSQRFRGNVAIDAVPVVQATVTSADRWLRFRRLEGGSFIGTIADAPIEVGWSADGVTYSTASITWSNVFRWSGFYARGDASIAGNLDVRFSDWHARTPYGSRPFTVYVFRDLGLGGSPDVLGASALLRRFRHAYVHAAAITSRSVLCDDTGSGCDLGPMGGI